MKAKVLSVVALLLLAVTGAWAQHALYGTQTNSQAAYALDSENHYVTEDLACANTLDGPTHPVPFTTTSKAVEGETITVYFIDALGWGVANVYYWPNGVEWPGVSMNKAQIDDYGQQVYSATIPAEVDGIIFNGNGNQTVDIKSDIADGAWWIALDEVDVFGNYEVVQSAGPEPNSYELRIIPAPHLDNYIVTVDGEVTGDREFVYGTEVVITATPEAGYEVCL